MNGARAVRWLLALCGISGVGLALAGPLAAQTLFTDVTEQAGLHTFPTHVRGLGFTDYDNDGLQDVFLVGDGWYSLSGPQRPRVVGMFRQRLVAGGEVLTRKLALIR